MMRLAITGATGFIGQHLVEHALQKGHEVIAITRNKTHALPNDHPLLTVSYVNLLQPNGHLELLSHCDAVIHLAALMQGSERYQQTLKSTRQLLSAMDDVGCKRLILVSSISILDYEAPKPSSSINETTNYCENDQSMGEYARMKRDQEKLCRHWKNEEKELVIVRPGLVYDDHSLPDAHAGFIKKGIGLVAKHQGEVPLVSIKQTTHQILCASINRSFANDTFHLINKSAIDQNNYLKQLKKIYHYKLLLPLPWRLYSLFAWLVRNILTAFKRPNKIPDSFLAHSVAARQKPFIFDASKANQLL